MCFLIFWKEHYLVWSQIMKFLTTQFSPASCYFPLQAKIFLQQHLLN